VASSGDRTHDSPLTTAPRGPIFDREAIFGTVNGVIGTVNGVIGTVNGDARGLEDLERRKPEHLEVSRLSVDSVVTQR
jgi:hypothetical protein